MKENPIHICALDHVVLRTANLQRSLEFYRDVLGCPVEKQQEELGLTQLRAGSSLIDLVDVHGRLGRQGGAAPARDGHNMDHFCLRITPWDEQAIIQHLRQHDIAIDEAGMRYGAEGFGPSIYIQDPDGNRVELKAAKIKEQEDQS